MTFNSVLMLWKVVFHVINFKCAMKMHTPLTNVGKLLSIDVFAIVMNTIALSWKEIFLNAKCKTIFLFPNFGDNAISRMTKNNLKCYLLEFLSSN